MRKFFITFIKNRRVRLDAIAKELKRENIWGEDQINAYLDNSLSDLLCQRRLYGQPTD